MFGTPPKFRAELLDAPIAELGMYWLGVRCTDRCNRTSYIPLKLMAARRGGRMRLRAVVKRLRCEHCKTPPASAWLTDYPVEGGGHGGQVATWRVELLPDAADGGD